MAHGYDLVHSLDQQKLAVRTGYWPLLRYNPARMSTNENPLVLDSPPPSGPLSSYLCNELRFTRLTTGDPGELLHNAEEDVASRWRLYSALAALPADGRSVAHAGASSRSSSATS